MGAHAPRRPGTPRRDPPRNPDYKGRWRGAPWSRTRRWPRKSPRSRPGRTGPGTSGRGGCRPGGRGSRGRQGTRRRWLARKGNSWVPEFQQGK